MHRRCRHQEGRVMENNWNRCDICGRFIAIADFDRGAVRSLSMPDSDRSRETWETLCVRHAAAIRKGE
jgi:hypothetical protein